ncbi:MAG: hypothetical protein K2P86_07510 [Xanthobacteraceae bacterium]|nr:hypothetical protein [Xanthobacteraceae bacterium]
MERFRQAAKRIDASDVVSLLREVYPEGVCGRNEAEALIAFDREFSDPAPEWRGFIAEAVADHLLRRSEPLGIITDEKAAWLIRAIAPSGRIATRGGVEALVRTVEQASELSAKLVTFAIHELWHEVITGEGPAVAGRPHYSRVMEARDVALLRRILEAGAGKSGAPVSADEAEALFDLHDAVAGGDNHASFDDLIFRAITNYLLSASGRETPSRKEALSREPRRDAGNGIAGECCAWLSSRIMRDGRPTAAERALLTLIDDGTEPDPSLRGSFDRAA